MNRKPISRWLCGCTAVLAFILSAAHLSAQQTTAFTYQGQLNDGGTNAYGVYTMMFALYDSASGGNQIGSTVTASPTCANGLFTVNLDFGASAFNGSARWLDITVTNGSDSQELSPRVQVLPTPYALYAGSTGTSASLGSGTWSAAVTNYQGYSNVFVILDNGSLVMGMTANGVLANNDIDANGSINASEFSLNSSDDFITTDDQGDLQLVTSNLVVQGTGGAGSSLQFPAQSGANIAVDANGNFTFDNNISISALGVLGFPGPGGGTAGTISGDNSGLLIDGAIQLNDSLTVFGDGFFSGGLTVSGCINGQFCQSSDKNLKEKFTPIDSRGILERVANLPISSWNYKQDGETRHIGPMAQDFYAAFNVGMDDKHIATVDESGVALAAIQGLNEKLKEKDAQIESLEKRLSDLEQLVKASAQK